MPSRVPWFRPLARTCAVCLMGVPVTVAGAQAGDLAARVADRAAIERVYHENRLHLRMSFEEAVSRDTLAALVELDAMKERVLANAYGEEVTPEQVAAETARIKRTTRAPKMLEAIKEALGGDPERFERAYVRPRLVARRLYQRFVNDAELHAQKRGEAESLRGKLLTGKTPAGIPGTAVTWSLVEPASPRAQASSADYSNEAEVEGAGELVVGNGTQAEPTLFVELPVRLQRVLAAQLRAPGDVSAVVETDTAFLVYRLGKLTAREMQVTAHAFEKRHFDEWLAEQP